MPQLGQERRSAAAGRLAGQHSASSLGRVAAAPGYPVLGEVNDAPTTIAEHDSSPLQPAFQKSQLSPLTRLTVLVTIRLSFFGCGHSYSLDLLADASRHDVGRSRHASRRTANGA